MAEHQPDIVHVHSPGPAGLLGVLTAQRLSIPLVQTYHTDLHAYAAAYRVPSPALWALARLYAHKLGRPCPGRNGDDLPGSAGLAADLGDAGKPGVWADDKRASRQRALDAGNELLLGTASAVIVPTAAVLERITLPVDPRKLYLVPTGVAAREAAVGWRERWGIADDDRVVLFVGRVNREKGIETLIPAFEKVLKAEPKAKLVLIGAVYEPRWLKRMIRTDRIVVTGQLPPDQVAAAYQAAEVFAFPSLTDTQALVLQEAALAGLPSVLLDEVLYERGILQRAAVLATPETFADGMLGLLREPAFARALGADAKENAQRHTPEAFAVAMLDIYGKFVRGNASVSGRSRDEAAAFPLHR
jgi:glycosyltransferase involved in cell wall biosynthesis